MGPLWLDVAGYELTSEEKEILAHPTVGGVILFSRNYHDNEQLVALTQSIRRAARRTILIGVDQEGGRVQRFRDGFTPIPAAQVYARQPDGEQLAGLAGWMMAAELIAHDIDLSFAPVLDKGFACQAIGNRAFGEDIDTVLHYSRAYLSGMKTAGMVTTGKHFPGHGGVLADSHLELPIDERDNLLEQDTVIFRQLIQENLLDAIMPAHVVYSAYDAQPASGSPFWLKSILRGKLGFSGVVFSDDLSMAGAFAMGDVVARSRQALSAGCDMILICNRPEEAIKVLDNLEITHVLVAESLSKKQVYTLAELKQGQTWKQANDQLRRLADSAQA